MLNEIIGGGLGVLGAWYDNRNDEKNMHETFDFNAKQAEINREFQHTEAGIDRELQREWAENGIRMRVADAVAAGLHPLVGAGVTPMQYSPIGVGGSQAVSPGYHTSSMGQNISRALMATMDQEAREKRQLEYTLLQSQVAETDARAGYYDALAFKEVQEAANSRPFPASVPPGTVQVIPDQKVSQDPNDSSRTAGADHPFFKRYEVMPGFTIDVPYSQEGPAEGMEGAGALAATIVRNMLYRPARYENEKFTDFANWIKRQGQKAWKGVKEWTQ